jgi:hypothetical protein
MDPLEKFLYNIAYKFPKGYPDMEDKQDILILENEFKKIGINLNELITTNHYNDRKKERGNILDIVNLNQQILGDKYLANEIKPKLIEDLEIELKNRLSKLEDFPQIPASYSKVVAYKVMKPAISINGKKFILDLKVDYTTKDVTKTNIGNLYTTIVINDKLVTLLLSEPESNSDIEKQINDHLVREKLPIKPIVILSFDNLEYIIPLDEPVEKPSETIDVKTLPYKVKASYRVGSDFTHNDYGTGKVVAAASSGTRSGEPDSRGIVDWVEVDFGRPYVSSGELKKTRIINKVYTTLSPLLSE